MKLLLFGARGYIGSKIQGAFPDILITDADIADQNAVSQVLDELQPEGIINAAGKTGRPNVDWCEDHKLETARSNVKGPLVLLEECTARSIYFVHIGSGCIYQGDRGGEGWTEEDAPNFTGSYYSLTKGVTDQLLKPFPVLQLRLRMPFDGTRHPRNFVSKLTKYQRVLDAENSLTYIPDLLHVLSRLIERKATGIYNVTNPGTMSPYRLMQMYREIVDPHHAFEILSLKDLPLLTRAGRSTCTLSSTKLQQEGIAMLPVEEAVRVSLQSYSVSL